MVASTMRWLAVIGAAIFLLFLGVGAFVATLTSTRDEVDSHDAVGVVEAVRERFADPLVMVVPHHDLVKSRRTRLFKDRSSTTQPDTIILLSPNHFDAGTDDIITTNRVWTVDSGEGSIEPATAVVDALVDAGLMTLDDTVFRSEHGIKNLLGEIHEFFPDATLVPVVLKERVDPARVELLVETLTAMCDECGVIASVDMSHYQPAAVAAVHDIKTIRALTTMNVSEVWDVEVDSQASLAFLVQWAQVNGLQWFELVDYTNSGVLEGNPEQETTTHLFGYFVEDATEAADYPSDAVPDAMNEVRDVLTFTFGGDAMFGRFVGGQFQGDNFRELFTRLGDRTFWGTDVSWVNLEGPVSDVEVSQSTEPDDTRFLFSRQAVTALEYLRLTTVGLGNNHTFDAGEAGFATTKSVLSGADVDVHGHPHSVSEESVVRYEQGSVQVSLIAVNVLAGVDGLEELILREDDAGRVVVVLPHWGVEYQTRHSRQQEELARAWVAAGADLVVGSHPHVVQDAQLVDGRPVFYSLGNFVFDQTFSDETQRGLLLAGEIRSDALRVVLVPAVSHSLRPELAHGEMRQQIIDRVCSGIAEACADGVIELPLSSAGR